MNSKEINRLGLTQQEKDRLARRYYEKLAREANLILPDVQKAKERGDTGNVEQLQKKAKGTVILETILEEDPILIGEFFGERPDEPRTPEEIIEWEERTGKSVFDE